MELLDISNYVVVANDNRNDFSENVNKQLALGYTLLPKDKYNPVQDNSNWAYVQAMVKLRTKEL